MYGRQWFLLTLSLLCVGCLLISQSAIAQPTVTAIGIDKDALDYSDAGLDYGNDGYWFANFDTGAPESLQPVEQNDADTLPSWMTLVHDINNADYSWANSEENVGPTPFTPSATSTGGVAGFNRLTLPDGTVGLSGQAVDSAEAGNQGQSNNIIQNLLLGPGTPPDFILRVVVDNEDFNTLTDVRRVKARLSGPGVPADTEDDNGNDPLGAPNNEADVYNFRYLGVSDGQLLKIQLRTSNTPGASAFGTGMAGFMIDVIPEPSSLALLGVCVLGLGSVRSRRRQ